METKPKTIVLDGVTYSLTEIDKVKKPMSFDEAMEYMFKNQGMHITDENGHQYHSYTGMGILYAHKFIEKKDDQLYYKV